MVHRATVIFLLLFLVETAAAQNADTWKKNGIELLASKNYHAALEAFQHAEQTAPPDAETRTNIGICYFHLNNANMAEQQLFAAFQAKNNPPPINYLYLAKLHQARSDFEKAASFYKDFLRKTPADHPWRQAVKDEIRRCENGTMIRRQPPSAAVLPLADINAEADDFKPLPSPSNPERLYFSTNGYSANGTDIFFTEIMAGDWTKPRPLSRFINGTDEEIALGFDGAGAKLYFFRGKDQRKGEILVDSFRENPLERTLFFQPFTGPMRPSEGDCEPFFFNDSILLFASSRVGGFGGLDIYFSVRSNGFWSPATNLGPVINSAYDETSPFLARDGRTIYFSSNDVARSLGGLDILRATWLEWSARWSPPVNLRPPINSAADDQHFLLNHSGDRGFFDSDRITGEGGRDIFVALFDQPRVWQLSDSDPVAFCLISEGEKNTEASERLALPPGSFFDEISSFELPVMSLPPPGGTPNELTVNQFAQIAQLLKKYPKLQATIALHSAGGDDPLGAFLFASQTAIDLLRQEGLSRDRVTLFFAGNAYPLSEANTGANRRAEVFFENPTELPFELYRPQLPKTAFKAQFFQKSMNNLIYRVVVAGDQGVFKGKEISQFYNLYPEALLEKHAGTGSLDLTPGLYLTYAAAEEWQKSLVSDGFTSAVVVPYLRGRALTKEMAAKYVEDFPDLKNFVGN